MRNCVKLGSLLAAVLSAAAFSAGAVERVALHALFKDKAIVLVDGARRVLQTGETSPEGVKLLSTDTQEEQAEIELDGKRQVLKLGIVISSFATVGKQSIVVYPDRSGHYFVTGLINGVTVRFLVDTGASTVTMGAATARRLGIDYRKAGRPGLSSTAAGVVPKYMLQLDRVQVGGSTLYGVEGGVIEGMDGDIVLLGMSFLNRFDMKRDSEKLELVQRY